MHYNTTWPEAGRNNCAYCINNICPDSSCTDSIWPNFQLGSCSLLHLVWPLRDCVVGGTRHKSKCALAANHQSLDDLNGVCDGEVHQGIQRVPRGALDAELAPDEGTELLVSLDSLSNADDAFHKGLMGLQKPPGRSVGHRAGLASHIKDLVALQHTRLLKCHAYHAITQYSLGIEGHCQWYAICMSCSALRLKHAARYALNG